MPDLGPPSSDAEGAGDAEGAVLLVSDEVNVAAIVEPAVDIAEWACLAAGEVRCETGLGKHVLGSNTPNHPASADPALDRCTRRQRSPQVQTQRPDLCVTGRIIRKARRTIRW